MADKLGQQFKEHEAKWESALPSQVPVIMRLDGKAFHTFTRGFVKPFSSVLHNAMADTAAALCKEIQNARFAYTQSDEISILIYEQSDRSQPWFGNRIQKMCSVAGSLCANVFNDSLASQHLLAARDAMREGMTDAQVRGEYFDKFKVGRANFDVRVFSLPKEEVQDYFRWRQEDAVRNSVSMLAQAHFSHRKLHKKNRRDMLAMLQSKGISWKDLEDWKKSGSVIIKQWREKKGPNGEIVHRSFWDSIEVCPQFALNDDFILTHLTQEEKDGNGN